MHLAWIILRPLSALSLHDAALNLFCNNDVFFELDRYTRRKILVLFQRNKSSQNPCLKWDTLYWLQVNQSFVLFSFFFWSLCFLSFFVLRILITLWYLQTLRTEVVAINRVTWTPLKCGGVCRCSRWVGSSSSTRGILRVTHPMISNCSVAAAIVRFI
jgi:hypothetical protein